MSIKVQNIVTALVCLVPLIFGMAVYSDLPNQIETHYGLNGIANQAVDKFWIVFVFPILLMLVQAVLCFLLDHVMEPTPLVDLVKYILPAVTVIMGLLLQVKALGMDVDVRFVVSIMLGTLFMILGNIMPKRSYYNEDQLRIPKKVLQKVSSTILMRQLGYALFFGGILTIIVAFIHPVWSLVVLMLAALSPIALLLRYAR